MTEKPFLCLTIDLDPMTASMWPPSSNGTLLLGKPNTLCRQCLSERRVTRCLMPPFGWEDSSTPGRCAGTRSAGDQGAPLPYPERTGRTGIRQFVRSGSTLHKISAAIHRLRADLGDDVGVTALSKEANMSRSVSSSTSRN